MSEYQHGDNRNENPQGEAPFNDDGPLQEHRSNPVSPDAPEPPANWQQPRNNDTADDGMPDKRDDSRTSVSGYIGQTSITFNRDEAIEFERARKYIVGSQICAIVSLFIGGALLSGIAIAIAYMGYRRLSVIADAKSNDENVRNALKRSGIVAIGMSVLALAINIVTLVLMYPIVMQALQQGNIASLFGASPQGSVSASPAQGTSLFG